MNSLRANNKLVEGEVVLSPTLSALILLLYMIYSGKNRVYDKDPMVFTKIFGR